MPPHAVLEEIAEALRNDLDISIPDADDPSRIS
jgi:hypothetical protein